MEYIFIIHLFDVINIHTLVHCIVFWTEVVQRWPHSPYLTNSKNWVVPSTLLRTRLGDETSTLAFLIGRGCKLNPDWLPTLGNSSQGANCTRKQHMNCSYIFTPNLQLLWYCCFFSVLVPQLWMSIGSTLRKILHWREDSSQLKFQSQLLMKPYRS